MTKIIRRATHHELQNPVLFDTKAPAITHGKVTMMVTLFKPQHNDLKKLSKKTGVSMSKIIRIAIEHEIGTAHLTTEAELHAQMVKRCVALANEIIDEDKHLSKKDLKWLIPTVAAFESNLK